MISSNFLLKKKKKKKTLEGWLIILLSNKSNKINKSNKSRTQELLRHLVSFHHVLSQEKKITWFKEI